MTPNKPIIFFKPARQVENTGDLLINKVLIELLRGYGNVIVDDSKSPQWFIDELNLSDDISLISSYTNTSLYNYLSCSFLKRKDELQGECFLFYPPGHVSKRGLRNTISSLLDLYKIKVLSSLGCKIANVGFTSGPFDYINSIIEKMRTHYHIYYGVRDTKSLAMTYNKQFENVHYFPDLAWAFRKNIHTASENKKEEIVVLSFRSNWYGSTHDENYLKPIISQVEQLIASRHMQKIKIYCVYQVEYDKESALAIKNHLSDRFNVELINYKLNLTEAVNLYSKSKLVVSNRLHVLLLASQCEAIPVALISMKDNKKISGIFEDNHLKDLILDIDVATQLNLNKFDNILLNFNHYLNILDERKQINTTLIRHKLDEIFNR